MKQITIEEFAGDTGELLVSTHVADERVALVEAFALLPTEAFTYVSGFLFSTYRNAGGFSPPARTALEQFRPLVLAYMGELIT